MHPAASGCATGSSITGQVRRQGGCREWIAAVGARTACIEPDSPWENGYCESFNSRLRDKILNGEVFHIPAEARTVIEAWRRQYHTKRPHSSLGYRTPAPDVVQGQAPPTGPAAPATPVVASIPLIHQD